MFTSDINLNTSDVFRMFETSIGDKQPKPIIYIFFMKEFTEWPSDALALSFLFHIYFRPFSSAFSSHLPLQANTRPKYSSFLFPVPSAASPLAWVIGVHFSSSYFSRHDRLMTFPLLLHFLPVLPIFPLFFIARGPRGVGNAKIKQESSNGRTGRPIYANNRIYSGTSAY